MNKFEQMLAIAPTVLALNACDGRGGVSEDYAEGYEDGYEDAQDGGSDGDDSTDQGSHVDLCREILAKAEEALADGYTANVTVDADPNEFSSGYEDGNVWMRNAFDTDDGNDQVHVPCTSLRIDGNWQVAGEADWAQNGSDLDMFVDFDRDTFDESTMVKLNWLVLQDAGPRFATDLSGDVDTIYWVDHTSDQPIGY